MLNSRPPLPGTLNVLNSAFHFWTPYLELGLKLGLITVGVCYK